jgi:hypothetical protein
MNNPRFLWGCFFEKLIISPDKEQRFSGKEVQIQKEKCPLAQF